MAHREGIFCDFGVGSDDCPNTAVGKCIGCGKDVCTKHGSENALSVSVQRQAEQTTSFIEMVRGGIAMCWRCLSGLERHKQAMHDTLSVSLKEAITEGVAVLLATETLKKSGNR